MTGTIGGESCGARIPIDPDGKENGKPAMVDDPAAGDANEAEEEGVRNGAADSTPDK